VLFVAALKLFGETVQNPSKVLQQDAICIGAFIMLPCPRDQIQGAWNARCFAVPVLLGQPFARMSAGNTRKSFGGPVNRRLPWKLHLAGGKVIQAGS
jgi:hypothetical protein